MKITFDFETRSACDLSKCGAAKYAEHYTTDVICCAVKVDNETPKLWFPQWALDILADAALPFEVLTEAELFELFRTAEEIEAHNAPFERAVAHYCCTKKYGWPELPDEKMRCSLAKCCYHALPRSLEQACQALNLPVQKDMEGSKLMLKLCKPRRITAKQASALGGMVHPIDGRFVPYRTDKEDETWKPEEPDYYRARYLWHETTEQLIRLAQYCAQDTNAEHALSSALSDLPPSELAIWRLDARINARGIQADVAASKRFIEEISILEQRLLAETKELTGGSVGSPKQVAASLSWLAQQGVVLPNMTKNTVSAALKDTDLPQAARRFLEIRKQLGRASTAKYQAIINAANSDGRIRGTLLYHGASTGRWSGKGPQFQNLPRGNFRDADACIEVTVEHGFDLVEPLWGDLMGAASTCLRGMIVAAPGNELISADFSSIEARVNAWIAGESHVLAAFREKQDLYKVAASQIFNKPASEVTKQERQIGKTVELACIAEDELVLTDKGLAPIQLVTTEHRVWDGENFVKHGGVVYKGVRDVITYNGLTATEDHLVWAEGVGECRFLPFGVAASRGSRLVQSGAGRTALRLGGNYIPGTEVHQRLERCLCPGSLYQLRRGEMDVPVEFIPRSEQGLPGMFPASAGSSLVEQPSYRDAATLRKPQRRRLVKLRRSGHKVQFPFCTRSRVMDSRQSRPSPGTGDRPEKQRWELRTGKSPICYESRKCRKPKMLCRCGGRLHLGQVFEPLCLRKNMPLLWRGINEGTDTGACAARGIREKEKLAAHKREGRPTRHARVYDIINCGPRHCFTVSDVLVHNCGYQGGIGAYAAMARNYGIDLEALPEFVLPVANSDVVERAEVNATTYLKKNAGVMSHDAATACDVIKQLWRQKRTNICALWRGLEEALLLAVKNPGRAYKYRCITYKSDEEFLRCKLPSGRYLHYYRPGLQVKETPWGEPKEVVTFYGVDSVKRKFVKTHIYGGGATENCVQAVSRDLMAEAMIRCENAGYPVVLSVHDELLSDVPLGHGTVEEFEALMSETPDWVKGYYLGRNWWGVPCPISAEGWSGPRYRK